MWLMGKLGVEFLEGGGYRAGAPERAEPQEALNMRVPLRPRDLIAVAAVSACALAASGTHVVDKGETLSDIAAEHGTTVQAIVEANGLSDADLIVAGQSLEMPSGTGSSSAGGSTYTVEDGDTLGAISRKFGTSVRALVEANGITNPNLIRTGTKLTIAGASSSAPASSGSSGGSGAQLPGQRHLVRPGETIAGIAGKYGVSTDDFVRWNGLQDGKIYASTSLILFDPGTLPGTKTASGPQTHTVANGETLSSIAGKYGSSSSAIAQASGLADANRISIGQDLTIPAASGGSAGQCPVPGANFINGWGYARSGGRSHNGIDLFAPTGTPVHAPASGWVDIATGTIGGRQFRLTDASGTLWFGSHMSDFGKSGQVNAGDVIGYVGDTGNAKGSNPHLHFEVHPDGQAVNPYPMLRTVC
jgi:LysM repeat protein